MVAGRVAPHARTMLSSTLLCAVGPDASAADAVTTARRLAPMADLTARFAHIVDPPEPPSSAYPPPPGLTSGRAQPSRRAGWAVLEQAGVEQAEAVVESGWLVVTLKRLAREQNARDAGARTEPAQCI